MVFFLTVSLYNDLLHTQRSIKWILLWAKHTTELCWKVWCQSADMICVQYFHVSECVCVCVYCHVFVHRVSLLPLHILLGLSLSSPMFAGNTTLEANEKQRRRSALQHLLFVSESDPTPPLTSPRAYPLSPAWLLVYTKQRVKSCFLLFEPRAHWRRWKPQTDRC